MCTPKAHDIPMLTNYGNFIMLYTSVIGIKLSMLQKIFYLLLSTELNSLVNYRQKGSSIMWPMYVSAYICVYI